VSKKVCTDDKVFVGGVDVSSYVEEVVLRHHVGELITVRVTFQAATLTYDDTGRPVWNIGPEAIA
jgi:hypothetical protein